MKTLRTCLTFLTLLGRHGIQGSGRMGPKVAWMWAKFLNDDEMRF